MRGWQQAVRIAHTRTLILRLGPVDDVVSAVHARHQQQVPGDASTHEIYMHWQVARILGGRVEVHAEDGRLERVDARLDAATRAHSIKSAPESHGTGREEQVVRHPPAVCVVRDLDSHVRAAGRHHLGISHCNARSQPWSSRRGERHHKQGAQNGTDLDRSVR